MSTTSIKQHPTLRFVLGPILRATATMRGARYLNANRRYQESVKGGSLILRPANIDGEFEIDAVSDLASRIVLSGSYEPDVTLSLQQLRPADGAIVNIGANIGFIAVFLARTFPKSSGVVAIEPNPEAFRLLEANISRNNLSARIQSVQACIGKSEGHVSLSTVPGKPEYSSVDRIAHPSVASYTQTSIEVPMLRLSSVMGTRRVSMMFIDTEGAESLVLGGAEDILIRDKPILFFECSSTLLGKFGTTTQELEDQLARLGYVVRNGLAMKWKIRHPFEGEGIAIHKDHFDSSVNKR